MLNTITAIDSIQMLNTELYTDSVSTRSINKKELKK